MSNMFMIPSSFSCFFIMTTIAVITATSYVQAQRQPSGRCIAAERAALLSFKAGITSDPLNMLESWRGQDCCEWNGVKCSNRTGRVIKLDLRNAYDTDTETFTWCFATEDANGLRGKISSSLVALEHLKFLDLTRNNLGGIGVPIPAFLGSFKSLTYLSLACMNFDGRVPPQLGNLSRLQHLNLDTSSFLDTSVHSDDISWLRNLSFLRFLDMSGLNLSAAGGWIQTVTVLPSLEVLKLSLCGLSLPHEPIPHSNLSSLQTLDLSFNRVDTLNPAYWFWNVRTIKELQLSSNQITGQFPNAIGNMTSLEVLDLGGNNISGVKSELLKGLCSLTYLSLWSNQINQDMAEFMEGMPPCTKSKLRALDLSATNLTGGIPSRIKQWRNLTQLYLSDNRLVGSVPLEIGNLTNLEELDLGNNQLNGSISEEHFRNLVSLGSLELSFNSLHIEISSNWVPPFNLQIAYFARCKMGPRFPMWLESQKNVIGLDISNTGIVDHLPNWFWTVLSTVSYLNISHNQIKCSLPTTLGFMSEATLLDLNSNSLSGVLPLLPKSLYSLDVSNNSLSGPLPQDFGAPMLRELLLSSNRINGTIPAYICQLHDLQVLDLSGNLLAGELPQCSEGKDANQKMNKTIDSTTRQLSVLALSNNNLSGKFPGLLQQSTQLTLLDLSYNKFFGELPTWIAEKLPGLSYVQLRYNMFSGSIPLQITELESLQILDISYNRITGTIPQALGSLKAMSQYNRENSNNPLRSQYEMINVAPVNIGQSIKYDISLPFVMKGRELHYTSTIIYMVGLDLSCNNLVGEIPDEIASLAGLINLNISHNRLTGKIPEKIGLLQALESLDLSFNELSGEIPWSLTEITSLSHLNLSYNNLSGRIPSGNQLQTLGDPESMYIGNTYLCGPPLSEKCLVTQVTEENLGGNKAQKTSFYLGLAIGFVTGLWMVFVILLFHNSWKVLYFQLLDKLLDKIQTTVAKKKLTK